MTTSVTLKQIRALNPCQDDYRRVRGLLGKLGKGRNASFTAADAVEAGCIIGDILWIAAALSDTDIDRRLRLWATDCATHVLHIYEADYPHDERPRAAIIAARRFARGQISAAARDAAWAAARAAAEDAARAAARAAAEDAAWAAARAAAEDAAWAAAEAAAWDAARAAAWDAARDAAWAAARDAERKWQIDRLVKWVSNPEPRCWPLPRRTGI